MNSSSAPKISKSHTGLVSPSPHSPIPSSSVHSFPRILRTPSVNFVTPLPLTDRSVSVSIPLRVNSISDFLSCDPQNSNRYNCLIIERADTITSSNRVPFFQKLRLFSKLQSLHASLVNLGDVGNLLLPSNIKFLHLGSIAGSLSMEEPSQCSEIQIGDISSSGKLTIPSSVKYIKLGNIQGKVFFRLNSKCCHFVSGPVTGRIYDYPEKATRVVLTSYVGE